MLLMERWNNKVENTINVLFLFIGSTGLVHSKIVCVFIEIVFLSFIFLILSKTQINPNLLSSHKSIQYFHPGTT